MPCDPVAEDQEKSSITHHKQYWVSSKAAAACNGAKQNQQHGWMFIAKCTRLVSGKMDRIDKMMRSVVQKLGVMGVPFPCKGMVLFLWYCQHLELSY